MPQKPGRPTSQLKDKELIKPPSPVDSVATPRTKEMMKFGGKAPALNKPKHFDRALKRMKETGKISMDDFNNAAELGAFIDFYNNSVIKKKDEWAENEILEISKFLAKMMTSKTIRL